MALRTVHLAFPLESPNREEEDITVSEAATTVIAAKAALSVMPVLDARATLHNMKNGMNDLPVEIPGLLSVLDEIAKIHVSISGAFLIAS